MLSSLRALSVGRVSLQPAADEPPDLLLDALSGSLPSEERSFLSLRRREQVEAAGRYAVAAAAAIEAPPAPTRAACNGTALPPSERLLLTAEAVLHHVDDAGRSDFAWMLERRGGSTLPAQPPCRHHAQRECELRHWGAAMKGADSFFPQVAFHGSTALQQALMSAPQVATLCAGRAWECEAELSEDRCNLCRDQYTPDLARAA